jgi:hypothetical protein
MLARGASGRGGVRRRSPGDHQKAPRAFAELRSGRGINDGRPVELARAAAVAWPRQQ